MTAQDEDALRPGETLEQYYDRRFADLDARGVADVALGTLEHLAHGTGDVNLIDRAAALRRRLEAEKPGSRHGRGQCSRCLRTFALNSGGEVRRHQTASGRPCLDPADMPAARYRQRRSA